MQSGGAKLPRIYCVNWFRTDENGKFVWPGFGDNMRVLQWMLGRVDGKAQGVEHVFGTSPRYDDLNWRGLNFSAAQYAQVASIDKGAWQQEFSLHAELFAKLADRLPGELVQIKQSLEGRLAA